MARPLFSIALLFASLALSNTAKAQSIELKIADSLPAEHTITKHTTIPFIKKVKAKLNDQIAFVHFPAEQLGKAKDLLHLTQSGLTDIGYIVPSYVSEKMPLGSVAELPGLTKSSCAATLAYYSLARSGGILDRLEFEPNGVRVLYTVVLAPYQAIFSKRAKVTDLDGFKSKKIRSNPGPMELSLKSIGATGVRMTPPEIFDALTKGTIDGALLPYTSTFSYGLDQVAGSATKGAHFGSVGITYSISLAKWRRLPAEMQEVLSAVGEEITRSACSAFDREERELAATLEKSGVKLFSFTAEQAAAIEGQFNDIADSWANTLAGRGKKGIEILAAFRAALTP